MKIKILLKSTVSHKMPFYIIEMVRKRLINGTLTPSSLVPKSCLTPVSSDEGFVDSTAVVFLLFFLAACVHNIVIWNFLILNRLGFVFIHLNISSNSFLWFDLVCLRAYQLSSVIQCQSYLCRSALVLFNL